MMKRRTWLKNSLAAALSSAGASAYPAEPAFKLNYLVGSAMYGNLPLAQIVPEVTKQGAQHLDVWPKVHGTQREEIDVMGREKFAELLAANNVKLACSTRYDLGPLKLADEITFVKSLGGNVIVTGGIGPKDAKGEDLKKAVKAMIEQCKPVLAKAAETGVTIAIENHINNIIDSPDSLRWLVEFSQGLPLGVELAPYHLPQDTALIASLIKDIGPKLTVLCAWEYGMGCMKPMPKDEELQQMPGRGKLDFTPILKALKEINYKGFTEIFMHPTPRGFPILPTAAEVTAEINRAKRYLERCLLNI